MPRYTDNLADYKFICSCLSVNEIDNELLVKGAVKKDWDRVIEIADANLISPALYIGLKRQKLFPLLEKEVQDYFEGIHALSVDRNTRLRAQGIELIKILNSVDIKPVLLKGLAGLLDGLYEDDGERIMSDIDVLIDESELSKALKVLRDNGYDYYQEPTKYAFEMKYKHHAPPLVAERSPASVELHIRPTILAGRRTLLDTPFTRRSAKSIEINGARALMPSPEFRLLHNFFHSQHQDGRNYRFGRLHIRGLLDWVMLRQAFDSDVDWSVLVQRVRQHHLYRSFSAYLLNAQEFFGQPIPELIEPDRSAWLHVRRQKLLLKHSRLAQINYLCLSLLQKSWYFFSPAVARRQYGDVSGFTVMRLQADKLMSLFWPGR